MTNQTAICAITNKPCPSPHIECSRCSKVREAKLPDWAKAQLLENRKQHIETLELPLEEFIAKLGAIALN